MSIVKPLVTIREQIADSLRMDIISGAIQPGERVREEVLAEKFGVSRGPIRDVLLQLNQEGLLSSKPNRGVTVNHQLPSDLHAIMMSLRLKLETEAIKVVAKKLEEADYKNLEKMVDNLRTALSEKNFTEATEWDLNFHQYLIEKAGGGDLLSVWKSITLRMRIDYQRIGSPKESYDEHMAIVKALREKDKSGAVNALKANIR